MIDKLKTYFENHLWFRILCYFIELDYCFFSTFIAFRIFNVVIDMVETMGEPDIHNPEHVLFMGAGISVFLILYEVFEVVQNICAVMNKYSDNN